VTNLASRISPANLASRISLVNLAKVRVKISSAAAYSSPPFQTEHG
jgi:hypothetical protein